MNRLYVPKDLLRTVITERPLDFSNDFCWNCHCNSENMILVKWIAIPSFIILALLSTLIVLLVFLCAAREVNSTRCDKRRKWTLKWMHNLTLSKYMLVLGKACNEWRTYKRKWICGIKEECSKDREGCFCTPRTLQLTDTDWHLRFKFHFISLAIKTSLKVSDTPRG